ncbi:hypothetical protein BDW74DRAFT_11327 [Aspergillus multicolor]|uniref:uncharacterized protein n=1 Tax=Aspergillus multicolor TaxID=41759 RepID=UPI003CCD44A6
MGIPRLRRHLNPFCQDVLLQNGADANLECIRSVVIDGPSLVYDVYSRLLSWFAATSCNTIDSLPTCDEVSRGVMLFLMHMETVGVEIKTIYFDGALPAQKHETRLARLESQRSRLESFCAETKNGFNTSNAYNNNRTVRLDNVLRKRSTPAKYDKIPVNPFIVPAVFEDLKCRWNRINITNATGATLSLDSLQLQDFPWASKTIMVSGEADAYCASAARYLDSCVLSNDSDLVLYDLGDKGSVVFLDSVEVGFDLEHTSTPRVRAVMLCPSLVAQRLGISSLLPLAYELKVQSGTGLGELLQQTKNRASTAESSNYWQFANEYQVDDVAYGQSHDSKHPRGILDARISELFWQCEVRGEFMVLNYPRVYLPVLNEDHTRQCSWVKGLKYRELAYSILNTSHPIHKRHYCIAEFVRRGRRIAEDKIELHDEEWVSAHVMSLQTRLESLQIVLERNIDALDFWRVFALCDAYSADAELGQIDFEELEQFLGLGCMGGRLEWEDLHLTAQMHAILYSLRILKQLVDVIEPRDTGMVKLRSTLESLPPLHIMMSPAGHLPALHMGYIAAAQLLDSFGCLFQTHKPICTISNHERAQPEPRSLLPTTATEQGTVDHTQISNIFELLQEQ